MSGKKRYGDMRVWMCSNAERMKDRNELVEMCERKFKAPRKRILDALSELRQLGRIPADILPKRKKEQVARRNGKGIFRLSVDVAEIKKEFDEEAKIIEGIDALGTRLIKDNDFRLELDVPIDRWKVVSTLAKFSPYKKELKGKRFRGVYWGSPDVIKELSKKIDML